MSATGYARTCAVSFPYIKTSSQTGALQGGSKAKGWGSTAASMFCSAATSVASALPCIELLAIGSCSWCAMKSIGAGIVAEPWHTHEEQAAEQSELPATHAAPVRHVRRHPAHLPYRTLRLQAHPTAPVHTMGCACVRAALRPWRLLALHFFDAARAAREGGGAGSAVHAPRAICGGRRARCTAAALTVLPWRVRLLGSKRTPSFVSVSQRSTHGPRTPTIFVFPRLF